MKTLLKITFITHLLLLISITSICQSNDLLGSYIGKEKCSQGRNKNQWSNPYRIKITNENNKYFLEGIYSQVGKKIEIIVSDSLIEIPEQQLTESFKISGQGVKNQQILTFDYTIVIDMSSIGRDNIINNCNAEYTKE